MWTHGGKCSSQRNKPSRIHAARLAADVSNVRHHCRAHGCERGGFVTNDVDERDHEFLTGSEQRRIYRCVRLDQAIARGISYAAYADRSGVKRASKLK